MKTNKKSIIAQREEEVLKFWQDNKVFESSLNKISPKGEFIFYDGPPFATGTPHYGHIIGSTVKDVVGRYKTMRGYHVARKWGWDCHGLPIENIAEKGLGISGRDKIEEMGIGKFNSFARKSVLGFVEVWRETVARIGRWVDFEGSYKTMDNTYIESVWWALKELDKKGLLYSGERVLPYCPRCETPISNSEIAMDNSYKDIKDISVIAKFKLRDEENTYVLAWTTTPWTLPGNVALAVGKDIDYVLVESESNVQVLKKNAGESVTTQSLPKLEKYICAKDLVDKVFDKKEFKILLQFKGNELIGKNYLPPFDYYINDKSLKNYENGWKIYSADFVTTTDGTGIVHIAPAFGEDDMNLAKSIQLPIVKHVNGSGEFTDLIQEFAGMKVKPKGAHQSGDILIIKYLARSGKLFSKFKIEHSYPHCHRCDTPLYYYAIPSWFLDIQKVKKRMIELNEKINWVPSHLKYGRFKHVLETAPDWNISRNRYWASPLPIWKCGCGKFKVIGSVAELKKLANQEVPKIDKMDLHRPYIDSFTINCESCKSEMYRVPEVFDCWFESGAMPFASQHYPFEKTGNFDPKNKVGFPGDFIAEYIPQTRTWFYYMLSLSTMLFDETSFLNVVTTGNVLASDGKKMSKSLKNYPDPQDIFDTYGVDALRLYLLSTPLMRGEDIEFSDKEVANIANKTFGRLVNVYKFYSLYKNTKKHVASNESDNILDKWIIARTKQLHYEVTDSMEQYELDRAARKFEDFVDDLSTWYIRRTRSRMKGGNINALQTTLWVLREFSKILAPFAPFHADWMWRALKNSDDLESVHLTGWGNIQKFNIGVVEEMTLVRSLISNALKVRRELNLPVRQPLASVSFKHSNIRDSLKEIISDELNVKKVFFDENLSVDIVFDVNLTQELIEEGKLRTIIRAIREARKNAGLTVGQIADATFYVNEEDKKTIIRNQQMISEQTFVKNFYFELGEFKVELLNYDNK
jgi:isoleucyl-tRNA synthetase